MKTKDKTKKRKPSKEIPVSSSSGEEVIVISSSDEKNKSPGRERKKKKRATKASSRKNSNDDDDGAMPAFSIENIQVKKIQGQQRRNRGGKRTIVALRTNKASDSRHSDDKSLCTPRYGSRYGAKYGKTCWNTESLKNISRMYYGSKKNATTQQMALHSKRLSKRDLHLRLKNDQILKKMPQRDWGDVAHMMQKKKRNQQMPATKALYDQQLKRKNLYDKRYFVPDNVAEREWLELDMINDQLEQIRSYSYYRNFEYVDNVAFTSLINLRNLNRRFRQTNSRKRVYSDVMKKAFPANDPANRQMYNPNWTRYALPLHINENHWAMVLIERSNDKRKRGDVTISLFDPFGNDVDADFDVNNSLKLRDGPRDNEYDRNPRIMWNMIVEYASKRYFHHRDYDHRAARPQTLSVYVFGTPKQMDDYNCGVYALWYVEMRLKNKSFQEIETSKISKTMIREYRKKIFDLKHKSLPAKYYDASASSRK